MFFLVGTVGTIELCGAVALVVLSVPFQILLVEVLTAMDGIFATDDEQQTADDRQCTDTQVQPDSEIIAGSFHSISPGFQKFKNSKTQKFKNSQSI